MTTNPSESIKKAIQARYNEIALEIPSGAFSYVNFLTCQTKRLPFVVDYSKQDGYEPELDLKIGCGIPTASANIKQGDTVLDLGCGIGNDSFLALKKVGPTGKVIGIDIAPGMVELARKHAARLGFANIDYREGDLESLPVDSNSIDVVISNCTINMVPEKAKVFSEIFRVLKPGGHCSISDIVLRAPLPDDLKKVPEFYSGCVAGTELKDSYLEYIRLAGFEAVQISLEKNLIVPIEHLIKYLPETVAKSLAAQSAPLVSVNILADKPVD